MSPSLHLRLDWNGRRQFGPGKAHLLALINSTGSISAAARALGMSYRRAWLLAESLNQLGPTPMLAPRTGGKQGGGAALTPFGHTVLAAYTSLAAQAAALPALAEFAALLQPPAIDPPL